MTKKSRNFWLSLVIAIIVSHFSTFYIGNSDNPLQDGLAAGNIGEYIGIIWIPTVFLGWILFLSLMRKEPKPQTKGMWEWLKVRSPYFWITILLGGFLLITFIIFWIFRYWELLCVIFSTILSIDDPAASHAFWFLGILTVVCFRKTVIFTMIPTTVNT